MLVIGVADIDLLRPKPALERALARAPALWANVPEADLAQSVRDLLGKKPRQPLGVALLV